MLYTELINKALNLSYKAHHGRLDKAHVPYIFHPYHLAEQMTTEYEICAALLHDVVEDTDYTKEDLRALGFPEEVVEAVDLLTHKDNQTYFEYINALKVNKIAVKVKLADLKHNSDFTRLNDIDDKAIGRIQKYAKAIQILSDMEGKNKDENDI